MSVFRSLKLHGFLLAAAGLLMAEPAMAEKRVALIIGNAAYQSVPTLTNPANDAAVIAAKLKDAGFDYVDARRDLPAADTRRALRDFADRARDADIAVVYYAGHGIEVDGTNYLIPVDARLERDTDVYDEAFSLDRVLLAIEPAKKLRLVILDACRDNPFSKSMKRTVASRAIGRGLAKVEPTSPNLLIAYSAKAGSTALDGDARNSPFTLALAGHLTTPGLDIRRAFGFVRDEVLKTTNNRQEPFVYGSLGGEDVPLVPAKAAPAPAAAPAAPVAGSPQSEMRRDYELALQVGNKDALNAFLTQYPDGFYANLAKIQLAKLAAEETRAAATEKAKLAEQERARLASEGAQRGQLAKAEAEARAAEQARIAAEKATKAAQEKALVAEQRRAATETPPAATASPVAGTPVAGTPVAGTPVAESTVPKTTPGSTTPAGPNLAALTPAQTPADLTKSVQLELRRVGCFTGNADGEWNTASRRSLTLFNKHAGTRLDVKLASLDVLDAIKLKSARVCPLACDHGFEADGERCRKIVCAEGSFLNDDNECEKRKAKKPVASRDYDDRPSRRERERERYREREQERERPALRERPEAGVGKPRVGGGGGGGGTGQIVCSLNGCRPVRSGCRIDYQGGGPRDGSGGNVEVCN